MYHLLVFGMLFSEEGLKSKRRLKVIKDRDLLVPFEEAMVYLLKQVTLMVNN